MRSLPLSHTLEMYAIKIPEKKYMRDYASSNVEEVIPLGPEFTAAEAGVFTLMRLDIQRLLR